MTTLAALLLLVGLSLALNVLLIVYVIYLRVARDEYRRSLNVYRTMYHYVASRAEQSHPTLFDLPIDDVQNHPRMN